MKFLNVPAIFVLLHFGNSSVNAEVQMAAKNGIPGRFIVMMKNNSSLSAESLFSNVKRSLTGDDTIMFQSLNGFAASIPLETAKKLSEHEDVAFVEQDSNVFANTDRWGLDRIDQNDLPLDGSYDPPITSGGAGVTAYIIDTGIELNHEDFGGRASHGVDFTGLGSGDCNGHGTHVAGTVGGITSGVAKEVSLVDVRVLNCEGGGTLSGVIGGVDWVTQNHDPSVDGPATVNMSLGGGKTSSLNNAVNQLVDAGITVVVAAGNDTTDACDYSPASASKVITVGSTTRNDSRSNFSNYGSCLNIFAPGSGIKSAWVNGGYLTISGTSMASPHICGVTALYLGENNNLSPIEVETKLLKSAVENKVTNPGGGSVNKLLQIGTFSPTMSPTTSSPTSSFAPTTTCKFFSFKIKLDEYPEETSWDLRNPITNKVILSRDSSYYKDVGAHQMDITSACIAPQCMQFTINDTYGDGLQSGAYYETVYDEELVIRYDGGVDFSTVTEYFSCAPTFDPPTANPNPPTANPPTANPPTANPPTSCVTGEECCSQNFKDCITWCGTSESECLSCNQDVHWIDCPDPNCLPRYSGCKDDPDGCCDGLTCVVDNLDYSQCRYIATPPTAPDTPAPTAKNTPAPTVKTVSSNPSSSPTETTSASPTSSENPCTICDDRESDKMMNKGQDCATSNGILDKKCNNNSKWRNNKWCQLSCYNNGNGYDGDVCCNNTPPTTPPPTQSPTKDPCNVICDDRETDKMINQDQECVESTGILNKKCNKNGKWINNKWCQLSCYNTGNGYDGDVCCNGNIV